MPDESDRRELELYQQGYSKQQIATELGRELRVVRTHITYFESVGVIRPDGTVDWVQFDRTASTSKDRRRRQSDDRKDETAEVPSEVICRVQVQVVRTRTGQFVPQVTAVRQLRTLFETVHLNIKIKLFPTSHAAWVYATEQATQMLKQRYPGTDIRFNKPPSNIANDCSP